MNAVEKTFWTCSQCLKPQTHSGAQARAEACCKCPSCGAKDHYSSMFKKCRLCDCEQKVKEARERVASANENLALYEKWLAEAKARREASESNGGEQGGG